MNKAAIVTGATGGIGKEFVRQLFDKDIDVIIATGRNEDRLNELQSEYGSRLIAIKADLASYEGLTAVKQAIEGMNLRYLVNNAGTAYMGRFDEMTDEQIAGITDINCRACAILTHMCLPYMSEGAAIINVSSASSFQPNPYLTMYSASKVFLKNFSRALNVELKDRKITSIAVCPGWVDTEMLNHESNGQKIRFPGMVTPGKVVAKALKDAGKHKDISLSSGYNAYLRLYSKYMPTSIVMKQWVKGIRKYVRT